MRLTIDTDDVESGWAEAGCVSVDSGQVMICDPCYLDDEARSLLALINDVIRTDFLDLCDAAGIEPDRATRALLQDEEAVARLEAVRRLFGEVRLPGGHARMVASCTGEGDGRYPVYAKVEQGRVVGLWIDFECGEHAGGEDDVD